MTEQPPAGKSRRPTMADVAARASRTLVSFILDGKPGASEETRKRVLAIAEEIGYRHDSAARLLAEPDLPTAVLAGNDRCALGLLDGFTRAGIDVPRDLSLIGYDDSRLSDNPRIDLTTVHQDAAALAQHAVTLAVEMLEEKRGGPEDVVLEPKLIIRGTTAAHRA